MFSKNATKIDKIFTVDLTLTTYCQIDGEDFVNFFGFLSKHELLENNWSNCNCIKQIVIIIKFLRNKCDFLMGGNVLRVVFIALVYCSLEDTFSPETLSTARNLQPRHFQPPDTFSHAGERHFKPWDTFSFNNFSPETLAAPRNFQLGETFSPKQFRDTFSPETILALTNFPPWETFSLEKLSASRNFQPRETFSLKHLQPHGSLNHFFF